MDSSFTSIIGDNSNKNVIVQGNNNNVKVILNGEIELSSDWFEHNLNVSISNLGVRYDNELNVEQPIAQLFNCLTRNEVFKNELTSFLVNIRAKFSYVKREGYFENEEIYLKLKKNITDIIGWYAELKLGEMTSISGQYILRLLEETEKNIDELETIFYQKKQEERKEKAFETTSSKYDNALYYLRNLGYKINDFHYFFSSIERKLADYPFLLITGEAGQGKSHLVADSALNHQKNGGSSILLLGGEFSQEEFWLQAFRFLGISSTCTKHDFLEKLNTYAETTKKRLLLCIDALNEGQGKNIWRGILSGIVEDIKKYKYLSLVITVRTNYETLVIPEILKKSIITVPHQGFRNFEYKAIKRFFEHHKLEQPSIPLLNPEFSNPLFLKLFCIGLNNLGLTKIPEGTSGISKVIDLFLNGINEAIYKKYQVSIKLRIAQKCADIIAEYLSKGKINYATYEEAFGLIDKKLKQFFNIFPDGGILQLFISEGLLKESRQWDSDKKQYIDSVEFNYERFGDHRQVSYFIDNYFSKGKNPFKKGGYLEYLLKDTFSYRTLFDALSIQLPEKLGKEFFEFLPAKAIKEGYIFYSLLDSIRWRETSSISNKTFDYIKEHQSINLAAILETFLSVTNNSNHPFNANFLHTRLFDLNMPQRDDFWTKYIFYRYSHNPSYEEGISAVQRLIDWAWVEDSNESYNDETIYLSAKAITWFLTSSNNTLRDSSTKAIVCLLTNRLNIANKLINDFKDVNDPYIIERLLAACYGAVTRSKGIDLILVQKVYDIYFSTQSPPTHLLSRDYARGIIEFSIKEGFEINGDISKIYPPYKSEWKDELLTEDELEEKYEVKDINWNNRKDVAQNFVFNLVMSDMSDFKKERLGNYDSDFSIISLQDEQRYKQFSKSLSPLKRSQLKNCRDYYKLLETRAYLKESKKEWERDAYSWIQERLQTNCGLDMSLSQNELQYFNNYILPYIKKITKENEKLHIEVIQRFIIQRTFELGWNSNLFGEFDYNIENSILNRGQNKSKENFGQKYINIAYYECLARLADNFYLIDGYGRDSSLKILQSGYDIDIRNIDPTIIEKGKTNKHKDNWWFKYNYNDWDKAYSKWIKNKSDLPNISKILKVTDSLNNDWIMLQGFPTWKEHRDVPYGELEHRDIISDKQIWYQLRSYIIHKKDKMRFLEWGKKQNFMGRWMIESPTLYDLYSREYFWSKEYLKASDIKTTKRLNWKMLSREDSCSFTGLITVEEYSKSNTQDFSLENIISIDMPSFSLKKLLNLDTKNGFEFTNYLGEVICFDPSIREDGLDCLLVRKDKLLEALNKHNFTIVWTVLGEKIGHPDYKVHGRLDISGCYYFDENNNIDGFFNFKESPD